MTLRGPLPDAPLSCEGLLSPAECSELIALAEQSGFSPAALRLAAGARVDARIRDSDRAIASLPAWRDLIERRALALGLPEIGGMAPHGLPAELRFYRYGPGQRFRMHKDGAWSEGGMSSKITLLAYLNDGFEGGGTLFRGSAAEPKAGMALLFGHGVWHEGAPVASGTKYVLRSDVLYRPAAR